MCVCVNLHNVNEGYEDPVRRPRHERETDSLEAAPACVCLFFAIKHAMSTKDAEELQRAILEADTFSGAFRGALLTMLRILPRTPTVKFFAPKQSSEVRFTWTFFRTKLHVKKVDWIRSKKSRFNTEK